MKRKYMTAMAAVLTCSMGLTIPAMAAEFSDGAAQEAIVEEKEIFDAGNEEIEEENQPAAFSDTETQTEPGAPEPVVMLDGVRYEYQPETDTYKLMKGVDEEHVRIPREIAGKRVTEIETRAFYGCHNLEWIECESWKDSGDSMVIGESAFENCSQLRKASLSCVVDIRSRAFMGCPKLSCITGPVWKHESSRYAADVLEPGCKAVFYAEPEYTIDQATSDFIKKNDLLKWFFESNEFNFTAEFDCFYYQDEEDPNYYEIYDYEDENKMAIVRDGTDAVRRLAFYDSDNVEVVILPEGMQEIQMKAFAECDNLKEIQIPESVKLIAEDAFENAPKAVIYADRNSYAYEYAKAHGIAVKDAKKEKKVPVPVITEITKLSVSTFKFAWEEIPYVDRYEIWVRRNGDKKWKLSTMLESDERYGRKAANSIDWWHLDYGETEEVKIRAIGKEGVYDIRKGEFTEPFTLKVWTNTPKFRSASNKKPGKIALKWTQPEGSEGYIVYRSATGDADDYTKIKTITKGSWDGYTDTKVKKGRTYYYKMKTFRVDAEGKRIYSRTSSAIKAICR